jgi:hypothetical protein
MFAGAVVAQTTGPLVEVGSFCARTHHRFPDNQKENGMMNKLVIAIALCAALAACNKEEAAPAADTAAPAADAAAAPATDTAAPAADAAATAAAPTDSGLPQECEAYLNRAKACFAKSGGNAAANAFQQAVDQSKAQWEAMADKTGLPAACKQADEQFAQTATTLKCE